MMLSDLQAKDIINIKDGNNLGRIVDAKVDERGQINYFVAEPKKMFKMVTRVGDVSFGFDKIKKIGEDVILVEI